MIYLMLGSTLSHAAEIRVAVASNFLATERALAQVFEQKTGHRVLTSSGSTGKLAAQISRGAPYDVFLGADTARARKMIKMGHGVNKSFRVYAIGQLALWCPKAADSEAVVGMLKSSNYRYMALANKTTAPYGMAATQVLKALNIKDEKIVYGENIAQTYQFVSTGHAQLGFVALSQLKALQFQGAFWLVPASLHDPIKQAGMIVSHTKNLEAAQRFMAFLNSDEARQIIREYGYHLPDVDSDGRNAGV